MGRLAARKDVVVVEVVVDPEEAEHPLVAVPVEVGDAEVAVGVAQEYAICLLYHHPSNTLGVESHLETLSP
jgi:hypothetical protein